MANVKIRYRFDKRTGRVTRLTVHADRAPEDAHDPLARAIADELLLDADIVEERGSSLDMMRDTETQADGQVERETGHE